MNTIKYTVLRFHVGLYVGSLLYYILMIYLLTIYYLNTYNKIIPDSSIYSNNIIWQHTYTQPIQIFLSTINIMNDTSLKIQKFNFVMRISSAILLNII